MFRFSSKVAAAIAGALFAFTMNSAFAASAEPVDIDPEYAAKVAKEKTKRALSDRADQRSLQSSSSSGTPCTLSVGSNLALPRGFAPREIVVINTAPIIQANSNCR